MTAALLIALIACSTPPETIALSSVDLSHKVVTTTGTAHYPTRIKQVVHNGFLGRDATVWLYPLLPPGDVLHRDIHFLVMDTREPDPLLGYEDRTITARVSLPTEREVDKRVRDAYAAQGYTFSDGWLLLRTVED